MHSTKPSEAAAPTRRAQVAYGFRALRVRNYRLFWMGQLISFTGTWMQTTAQAWLVLKLTGSPIALGTVTALQFLPMMLLTPLGGLIADRVPRYRLVVGVQGVGFVLAAIFGALVATGLIQLWQIYVLALLQGLTNAVGNPSRLSFAVELVGKQDRGSAIALNSTQFNIARIVGPAAAGLMFETLGVATILFVNALTFLVAIGWLSQMDQQVLPVPSRKAAEPVLQSLREGLGYTLRTPEIMLVMIVTAAIGTFGYNFTISLPLIAEFILRANAAQFGLLSSALGLGSLVAALNAAYTREFTSRRLLFAAGAFGLLLAALSVTTLLPLAAALLVALGFAGITYATTANTLLQLRVPDRLRGRVSGIYLLLFVGSTPIGGLFIGTISEMLGVSLALLLCAGLCMLGVVGGAFYKK
jgi:MFS family permease